MGLTIEIRFSKKFQKQYKKLAPAVQLRFKSRLAVWNQEPMSPQLNHHVLTGKLAGFHSINVGGDVRALYQVADDSLVIFEKIGTHSQLYK